MILRDGERRFLADGNEIAQGPVLLEFERRDDPQRGGLAWIGERAAAAFLRRNAGDPTDLFHSGFRRQRGAARWLGRLVRLLRATCGHFGFHGNERRAMRTAAAARSALFRGAAAAGRCRLATGCPRGGSRRRQPDRAREMRKQSHGGDETPSLQMPDYSCTACKHGAAGSVELRVMISCEKIAAVQDEK